jgi:hypothetical protein
MFSTASSKSPAASVTRTMKLLGPTLEFDGVPESAPLEATLSQAGPEDFE